MNEHELKSEASRLAGEITSMLNTFSDKPASMLVEAMTREHRTLQQSFTKLCMKWLEKCASNDYGYDGRNEASHEVSKRMIALYEDYTENVFKFRGTPSKILPLV